MSYIEKIEKIKNKLSFYSRESVLDYILKHLHKPLETGEEETRKMPWVCFLAIEWHYQIQIDKNPKVATDKQVYNLLNQIYLLQSSALDLDGPLALELGLRKLFLVQMRCQRAHMFHLFTLSRLFTLMNVNVKNSPFSALFFKETGVELKDFYLFSLWLLAAFQDTRFKISYENILLHFYPAWNLEKLVKIIKLVSTTPENLGGLIQEHDLTSREQYFSKPQLLKCPLLLMPNSIQAIHPTLVAEGISEFTLNIMKVADHQKFRKHFTKSFEKYIEIILKENSANYQTEAEIKTIYKQHGVEGKVVDFIYESDDAVIYIDAKGVEPQEVILVTDNQKVIKSRLKNSYLKGLEQACECSGLLDKHTQIIDSNKKKYALIVTHQDFYLGFGKRLSKVLGKRNIEQIIEKCGTSISFDNVHFCSAEDFESVMALCKKTNSSLDQFLDYCSLQQEQAQTQKFCMRQHINDFTTEKSDLVSSPIGTDLIVIEQKSQFDIVELIIKKNKQYRQKRGSIRVVDFINTYLHFKKALFAK